MRLAVLLVVALRMSGAPTGFRGAATELSPAVSCRFEECVKESETQYVAKNYREAEESARMAVRQNRLSRKARYWLGMSLVAQRRATAEALENLRAAVEEYPQARMEIARLLLELGKFEEAMAELKTFVEQR